MLGGGRRGLYPLSLYRQPAELDTDPAVPLLPLLGVQAKRRNPERGDATFPQE